MSTPLFRVDFSDLTMKSADFSTLPFEPITLPPYHAACGGYHEPDACPYTCSVCGILGCDGSCLDEDA